MNNKPVDPLDFVEAAQEKHKAQPSNASEDIMSYGLLRQLYAGFALMGMMSECRLGKAVSQKEMQEMCRTAKVVGTMLAEEMS